MRWAQRADKHLPEGQCDSLRVLPRAAWAMNSRLYARSSAARSAGLERKIEGRRAFAASRSNAGLADLLRIALL